MRKLGTTLDRQKNPLQPGQSVDKMLIKEAPDGKSST